MSIKKITRDNIDFNNIYKNSSDAKNGTNASRVSEKYQEYWGDNGTQLFFDDETGAVYEASPDATDMTGATRLGFIGSVINDNTNQSNPTNAPAQVSSDEVTVTTVEKKNTEYLSNQIRNISTVTKEVTQDFKEEAAQFNKSISTTSTNSNSVTVDDNRGQYYTVTNYDRFYKKWTKNTGQRAVADIWNDQGQSWSHGIATINVDGVERYLVATTTTFGKPGDTIDVHLKDGTTIQCIIADAKSSNDPNWSKYGHTSSGQVNVLEWEVNSEYFKNYGNPSSTNGYELPWDSTSNIVSIDNTGSII